MDNAPETEEESGRAELPGEILRDARKTQKKSLDDIVGITRIPKRHLEAIEAGDFSALPSRTYAVGFSRNYARALGVDQDRIVGLVRDQLTGSEPYTRSSVSTFEPVDPARVPSRGLAWFSALSALLLIAGAFAYFGDRIFPGSGPAQTIDPATEDQQDVAVQDEATQLPLPANPEVVFTSLEDGIWIKFYDDTGRLLEKQMAKGERYIVPKDAQNPLAWTGRPDAFTITVGGRTVPPIGEPDTIVRDVPVTAEALLARGEGAPPLDGNGASTP